MIFLQNDSMWNPFWEKNHKILFTCDANLKTLVWIKSCFVRTKLEENQPPHITKSQHSKGTNLIYVWAPNYSSITYLYLIHFETNILDNVIHFVLFNYILIII